MSVPQEPKPAKLVIGLIVNERRMLAAVAAELLSAFGCVDLVSSWLPFEYTQYYAPEMGSPLFRRVLAFKNLIQQEELADIKIITNRLEEKFLHNGKRKINIDPGYLLHERFVLASGKNFSHRIYIGRGIYADLTLIYQGGVFQRLPWTYPDYADRPMLSFLERVRDKYIVDYRDRGEGGIKRMRRPPTVQQGPGESPRP
jgi:hypothetical protein